MTSDSFRADSTLGQPTPLMDPLAPPQSLQYDLFPGFWYALDGGMGYDLASFAATFGLAEAYEGYNAACIQNLMVMWMERI